MACGAGGVVILRGRHIGYGVVSGVEVMVTWLGGGVVVCCDGSLKFMIFFFLQGRGYGIMVIYSDGDAIYYDKFWYL